MPNSVRHSYGTAYVVAASSRDAHGVVSNTATNGTPGNSFSNARIAAMYGGLCAGAKKAKSSIAANSASSTRYGPDIGPGCTTLKPAASTSDNLFSALRSEERRV